MTRRTAQPTAVLAVAQAALAGMLVTLLAPHTAQADTQWREPDTSHATTAGVCGPQAQAHSLEQLLQNVPTCQLQPDWLAYLGQRLNEQGRYPEAAEHLERALMLAPQHLGAAFAYAKALAGSGDLPSALQLLAQLSTRPDVPEPQRRDLLAAQVRMAEAPLPLIGNALGWTQRHSAGLRVGYDNNLLGAPRLNSLTLTLPGGDATLPLEAASQPRPGTYQRADVRLEATHTHSSGRRTEVALALQYRNSPSVASANTTQTEWLLDTQPGAQANGGPWASLGLTSLHTQGGTHYRTNGLAGGWAWQPNTNCQPRLGAEWQTRRLTNNALLSGNYGGLVASWGCNRTQPATGAEAQPWLPQSWHIYARAGVDQPTQTSRPGGAQRSTALRATLRWPLWVAEAELLHTQDAIGYSPLLGNNLTRHSTRGLLRLERFFPLQQWSPGLYATVGVEMYGQQANLVLFKIHSTSVYAAVRKQW
jgi:hypothetical protein